MSEVQKMEPQDGQSFKNQPVVVDKWGIQERERKQSRPFHYKRQSNVFYIPVYPRAYVEEVVNIDYDRRTVTAKFVVMITVCTKVEDDSLRKFLQEHLILEFGYNQTIYIPEHITLENSPFLITRLQLLDQGYVTYRIKGAIQSSAFFDSMYFPYRSIEIVNHLCIRPQEFRIRDGDQELLCIIKYNIMMLAEDQDHKYYQFLPYLGKKKFGSFKIDHYSTFAIADVDPHVIERQLSVAEITKDIFSMVTGAAHKTFKVKKTPSLIRAALEEVVSRQPQSSDAQLLNAGQRRRQRQWEEEEEELNEQEDENDAVGIQPYQHMAFRFTMSSISIGFVWQQEIPIWILSIVALFLFEAQPNIGNKYSNVILLLVSYVSVISNFRRNNVAQQSLTFFEFKLMALTVVPILLIITTAIDYYNMDNFNNRSDQVYNPFAIASIVIVLTFLAITLVILIYLWISKFLCEDVPKLGVPDNLIDWINMVELDWRHNKLDRKISQIFNRQGKQLVEFRISNVIESIKSSRKPKYEVELQKEGFRTQAIKIKQTFSQQDNFS